MLGVVVHAALAGKQVTSVQLVLTLMHMGSQVGVGCASAKEVQIAVQKAAVDAKKNLITIPLTKAFSFPHRQESYFGAAKVMLRPASDGTGLIAGQQKLPKSFLHPLTCLFHRHAPSWLCGQTLPSSLPCGAAESLWPCRTPVKEL